MKAKRQKIAVRAKEIRHEIARLQQELKQIFNTGRCGHKRLT
jgi:hypothetical protein